MEGSPDTEIPTPPVQAQAQTAPTFSEGGSAVLAPKGTSQDFLGQDLAADMSGLVQESGKIVFQPITVAAFNALYRSACDAKDRAETSLENEQERNRDVSAQAAKAEQRAAVLQERLESARESASLRNVGYTLGGAALGLIPFAAEKSTWVGGLIVAVFGLVLLLAAIFIRAKPSK